MCKWNSYACVAVFFSIPFLHGCKKEAAPEVVVTVQAAHPEQGEMTEQILADAVLAPQAQAAIVPKITAPVKKFFVQRGQHVKVGQLLAELESADLAAAALDNKGSYLAAQAGYDTAVKAQVPEDQLKAESDLAQARANLALNQSIVKSRKQLYAEGAISGRDLDTAEAALVQAQAAYDAASKHIDSLRNVSHEAALKAAQGQLTSAESKLNGARAQAGYAEIRSPIDGVVTDRPLFAGETAAAGAPLLTIMDTAYLLAKTHIAQSHAQRLQTGQSASVIVPGVADPVPAKIEMISPALDPGSTTVEVWLKIVNKNAALKAGTPVKVSITGRKQDHAIHLPAKAILTAQDGTKSVMLIGSDGMAHRKAVQTGMESGDDVQIVSGVSLTDTVIVGGAYGLDEGTKVKLGAAGEDGNKPANGGDAQ